MRGKAARSAHNKKHLRDAVRYRGIPLIICVDKKVQ